MKFYSTKNRNNSYSLEDAVLLGLPPDNGLFMPKEIDPLSDTFLKSMGGLKFPEIAFGVLRKLLGKEISNGGLWSMIETAFSFPVRLVNVTDHIKSLELYHGPTLAFKDFGARFMAQLFGYILKNKDRETTILVATSGDTGSAVASGFYNVPGVNVIVLYPSGLVSEIQEKQLTTFGGNITAYEVSGSFDECQDLVKRAFLDEDISQNVHLSSANSINIARLFPQATYYFEAYKLNGLVPMIISIPSGNFGNLTACVIGKKMGLPIEKVIAATNSNSVVPEYLKTGNYKPRPSVTTLSNAMDVGRPSNFSRLLDIYGSTWNNLKKDIVGYSFSDEQTIKCIQDVHDKKNYLLDPHGAIGYLALETYLETQKNASGIFLETAHPGKFKDIIEKHTNISVDLPGALRLVSLKEKNSKSISHQFDELKQILLNL